jgi:hypothetical protein
MAYLAVLVWDNYFTTPLKTSYVETTSVRLSVGNLLSANQALVGCAVLLSEVLSKLEFRKNGLNEIQILVFHS